MSTHPTNLKKSGRTGRPPVHGKVGTRVYNIWQGMKKRCYRKKNINYPSYGGRGIKVCERWHDFINFFADMGTCPAGYQLDRKDNEGDYTPENCRWVTPKVNSRNKRDTIFIEHDGLRLSVNDWSDRTGIASPTIIARIEHGWSVHDALTVPVAEYTQAAHRTLRTGTRVFPMLTANGVTKLLCEWCEELGCDPRTVYARLNAGWPVEKALTQPIRR